MQSSSLRVFRTGLLSATSAATAAAGYFTAASLHGPLRHLRTHVLWRVAQPRGQVCSNFKG